MQQSKIDSVVNQIIDQIRGRERGFVLDLGAIPTFTEADRKEAQDRVLKHLEALGDVPHEKVSPLLREIDRLIDAQRGAVVEVRESLKPVDEYQRPADFRRHTIGDTASLIAYATKYGNKDKSLVLYNDEQVQLVIDEQIERGEREIVTLGLQQSEAWNTWSALLGRPQTHRNLFKSLILLSDTLADPLLLDSMRSLKVNVNVKHDSDLQDDAKTIGIFVETKAGEELKRFPKVVPIKLPVLDQDVDHKDQWRSATLRLEIDLPEKAEAPTMFTLYCPQWSGIRRERVRLEADLIVGGLKDWTVVRGQHSTAPRNIGRNKS